MPKKYIPVTGYSPRLTLQSASGYAV